MRYIFVFEFKYNGFKSAHENKGKQQRKYNTFIELYEFQRNIDSIKNQDEKNNGSRSYLHFLRRFLEHVDCIIAGRLHSRDGINQTITGQV